MNFFEHQELARKKTARLVALFAIAVVLIVLAIYAISVVSLWFAMGNLADPGAVGGPAPRAFHPWDPIAAAIALGVGVVLIGGGSLYKMSQLRSGGMVIAEELGGRLLTHQNADTDGKRLLNIVEEMAIASGVPVPPVYLLPDEEGINAFAAGYAPDDAVIGVTHGAVHGLSRDQLQGVIAHEFSHILSGDMRLNLRLVAVLHGILILGLTGAAVMRGLFYSGATHRSRSSRDNGGGGVVIAIFAIAAALAAIGYIGTFFGNLIKSAVSRQREFLADASAVQFTRNPDGIAGALKVLGGAKRNGKLRSPNAPEASHMFFADALTRAMGGAMSTHPPLDTRIRRIEPGWDGEFLSPRAIPAGRAASRGEPWDPSRIDHGKLAEAMGFDPGAGRVVAIGGERTVTTHRPGHAPVTRTERWGDAPPRPGEGFAIAPRAAVARAGVLDAQGVAHAQALLARIPRALRDAAQDPHDARAIILAMLVARDARDPAREKQAEALRRADAGLGRAVARVAPAVVSLDDELRLPLLEQAMQPLASLTPGQVTAFRGLVDAFIEADDAVTVFEWVVRRLVTRRLDAAAGRAGTPRVRYYALGRLGEPCSVLLSAVARAGARPGANAESDIRRAFAAGASVLAGVDLRFRAGGESGPAALSGALDELETTAPKLKQQLLEACGTVIMVDGTVTPREAELFRAVGESLRVPMPVLFATDG